MALNWRDVGVFYRYELRAALRERSIVVSTFLIPIFMYPFLLWAMFTGITFIVGQTENLTSRIAVRDTTGQHAELATLIGKGHKIELVASALSPEQATEKIKSEELDAFLDLRPAPPAPGSPPRNFSAFVYFDRSKDRSDQSRARIRDTLEVYRSQWLEREAERLKVTGPEWQKFLLEQKNVATGREMGTFILSMMLPLFLVIMIALGCFYPSIDATAGERERSTWETTMSMAASRRSIMTAKYLYVATLGSVAGLINLAAMMISARPVLAPLAAQMGEKLEYRMPLLSLPVVAVGTVLLALFIAAVMMILASFARTFREGQSMITPFYLAILLPVIFIKPEQEFTPLLALVPIVNVTKLFGEAVNANIHWYTALLTLLSEVVCIGVALRLAAAVTRFEDFMIGSYSGSFGKFVKERLLAKKPAPGRGMGEHR